MLSTASCDDDWATDRIDLVRRRLADVADMLAPLRRDAAGLAGRARWDSDAANAFRSDAEALAADVASLTADVERVREELLATRAHALQRATWGCG